MSAYPGSGQISVQANGGASQDVAQLNFLNGSNTVVEVGFVGATANVTVNASGGQGILPVISNTQGVGSPLLLTEAMSGKFFNNAGALARAWFTLPNPDLVDLGVNYTFFVSNNNGIGINTLNSTITFNGSVAASSIQSATDGSTLELVLGAGGRWVATFFTPVPANWILT